MSPMTETLVFWAALGSQLLGLASFAIARLCERPATRRLCVASFYASLLAVGAAAALAVGAGNGQWLSFASAVALMAVGATFDQRPGRQAVPAG
jgi:hypothetical protein